jgi:hypothetical protein
VRPSNYYADPQIVRLDPSAFAPRQARMRNLEDHSDPIFGRLPASEKVF